MILKHATQNSIYCFIIKNTLPLEDEFVEVLSKFMGPKDGDYIAGYDDGDNVKMGVLTAVMPGKMIGDSCWIDAGIVVKENVERKTHLVLHQALTKQKLDSKPGE